MTSDIATAARTLTYKTFESDPAAALREKLSRAGIEGQIRLPVLEVNGDMLANDPEISEVQRHLKTK